MSTASTPIASTPPEANAAGTPRPADAGEPITPRQCGRCRLQFAGDPTLNQAALAEWWLCPDCRVILLGDRPAPSGDASDRVGHGE